MARLWKNTGYYAAGFLLIAHIVCVSTGRNVARAHFIANVIELTLAIVVLLVVEGTAQRCTGYIQGVWRLLEVALGLYSSAQILWICSFLRPGVFHSQVMIDLLFNLWFVPLGLAILIEPDADGRWFNATLFADVLQAVIFGLLAYRFFQLTSGGWSSPTPQDHLSALSYFVYAVLIGSFFLRSRTSGASNRRALFRHLGILLSLSCLLDLIDWSGAGERLPAIFQVRYALVLCVPLLIVMRWNAQQQPDESRGPGKVRYSRITLLLPLLYPSLILYMASTIIRGSAVYTSAMVALSFLTSSARQMLTQDRLHKTRQSLERQATHDALTGLWNHGAIRSILELELRRKERIRTSVGVLMLDLDYFKSINDSYGHEAGDRLLQALAATMPSCLRPYDSLGRYGGEEFLIVAPGCTQESILILAERVRETVASVSILVGPRPISVSASVGVSTSPPAHSINDAISLADMACYRAKAAGRNQICTSWSDSDGTEVFAGN